MNSTILITASSGIGAATARLLAGPDARIFLVSRTEAHCAELAAELRTLGAAVAYLAGDLTARDVAPAAVRACVEQFGRLDALFNVAGISGRKFGDGPIHECTEEGWAITLDTNLTTQYRMCREATRAMLAQPPLTDGQRGVILNMSSVLGIHPEAKYFDTVAYAASKGAIIGMSRSMAARYAAENIRVNVIAPALVRTPMSARASEDETILDFIASKQPLTCGLIAAEDVASVCQLLLTDASRAMTGEVVKVDGGWCLA